MHREIVIVAVIDNKCFSSLGSVRGVSLMLNFVQHKVIQYSI